MSNSTNSQLSIVDELRNQLTEIKDKIKESSASSNVFDTLTGSAKLLQDKINFFLGNKGFLNQSDVNDAYATIQDVKRNQLDLDSKKAKKNAYMYGGLVIAGIIGIYLLLKQKNKG